MSWAFWLEGVCIPIISTFGLLGKSATFLLLQVAFQLAGNICSIWVLSSRRAHLDLSPTFTSLLICLVSRPAAYLVICCFVFLVIHSHQNLSGRLLDLGAVHILSNTRQGGGVFPIHTILHSGDPSKFTTTLHC